MKSNSKNLSHIYQCIREFSIVSFDVFDTLLLRNVINPTDVFRLVELEYYCLYSKKIPFLKIRVEAEEKARRQANKEDIHLDDIYNIIRRHLGDEAEEFKRLEFELEKKILVANPEIKPLFDMARELNKKIYIISDMYLPSQWIGEILDMNGIRGYDRLFVSGELNLTKSTGSMYEYIRKSESISDSERWFHIGDNAHSDYFKARKHGIESYHYIKPTERFEIGPIHAVGDSIIRALQINGQIANQHMEYWYRFGWEVVGPLYTGLMFWLADHLRGKDNIYFLSRDGYLPYRLYNMLRKFDADLPEGRYLYASRRAIIYPHLPFEDREHALDILTAHNPALGQKLTVKDIFANLELNPDNYEYQLEKCGISVDTIVTEKSIGQVHQLLESIWDDITRSLYAEGDLLRQYFEDNDILKYDTLYIFDIGWRGSTHLALQRLLEKPVHGYYFGTTKNIFEEIRERSYGYAFERGKPAKLKKRIFEHIMMYELVFSAPEGSLIRFVKDDSSGRIQPYLKDVEKNEGLYAIIDLFQKGVTDLFEKVLFYNKYIHVSKDFALSAIDRFIHSYRIEDLLKFSQLTNSIGLGEAHAIKRYVTHYDIDYYLANRKQCDREASRNLWKHAMVIHDHHGRCFNKEEIQKLYKLRRSYTEWYNWTLPALLKKAVKNPKKAIRKLLKLIRGKR